MRIGIDFRNIGKGRTGDEVVFFSLVRALIVLPEAAAHQFFLFVDNRTEEELERLAERLTGSTKEMDFSSLQTQDLSQLERNKTGRFQFVNLKTSGKFHWNTIALPWALRQYSLDVYHTQYITPFFVPKKVAIVTHVHDVSFARYPKLINWKDRIFLTLLIPRSFRQARAIVAVSAFTKREIIECYGVSEEKIFVVPNALSDEYKTLAKPDDGRLREKYQLPAHYILSVGTLQPRKNIPFLIRAFATIKDRVPNVALVVVGNRNAHHFDRGIDEALQETDLEGRVIFPGFIDQEDLPGIMRQAELFVFPSLYEGFGLPLLEALSQDVPVVAADIPVLHEVGGDAALYINPSNLAMMSEALYNGLMSQDVRSALMQSGHDRIQAFSWQESARKQIIVYESILW